MRDDPSEHACAPRARDFLTTEKGSAYAERINERRLARLAREKEKRMLMEQAQEEEQTQVEDMEQVQG